MYAHTEFIFNVTKSNINIHNYIPLQRKSQANTLRRLRIALCFFVFIIAALQPCNAQKIMLKTNALGWATLSPNGGLELRMSRHYTLNLEAQGNFMRIGNKQLRHLAFAPEVRYWLNGRPQIHHFVGLMALGATYNVGLNKNMHRGFAMGAGVTYGYSMVLGKHWSAEATIGAGLISLEEKKWPIGDKLPSEPNVKETRLLPTKLGLSLVYMF